MKIGDRVHCKVQGTNVEYWEVAAIEDTRIYLVRDDEDIKLGVWANKEDVRVVGRF